jgi:ParB/RepB/Spo0J family partition protein
MSTGTLESIALDELHVHGNYRGEDSDKLATDPAHVARIADDMRARGYRASSPIQVRPRKDGGFWIVAGHHRYAAAIEAELTHVLAVVEDLSERDALLDQLEENLGRKASNPLEEGRAFLRAMKEHGATVEEIAARVLHGPKYVEDRCIIASLDPTAGAMAARYGIGYGLAVADLPHDRQAALCRAYVPGMNLDAWTMAAARVREEWQASLVSGMFDAADYVLESQEWDTKLGAYVTDAVQAVEESKSPTVPLGREEIAAMLDVKIGTVSQWITRGIFPGEDMRVSGSPLWWPATVEEWARETGRL